jgi:hypothetical protein
VHANPQGREFGFARRILLTGAGREHPFFAGKPLVFEAPTVHRDGIAVLPSGAEILARNDFGVQAAAFTFGRGTFWGVQPRYCLEAGNMTDGASSLLPRNRALRADFMPVEQTRLMKLGRPEFYQL